MKASGKRAVRTAALTVALVATLASTACSDKPSWHQGGAGTGRPSGPAADPLVSAPANGSDGVATATEIVLKNRDTRAQVTLTDAGGASVAGAMRADGSSWVPAEQLAYGARYTAKISATGPGGKRTQETLQFTTMSKPSSTVRISTQLGDNLTYGVGMPIVVNFGADIPQKVHASVERRLFVSSDPPQEGVWNWFNDHEVHFRPQEFWQPHTKIHFRLATGGLPMGNGRYGGGDITVDALIGRKLIMTVDNRTKSMVVTRDGVRIKTMPVSLGKSSKPSFSGTMVVMVRNKWEWFDSSTYGVPVKSRDGYRTKVYWTERLTWDGQYIHAAPWSVGDQGHTNVSHGCVNISTENAHWLYDQTMLGDPVEVKNTEKPLTWGNGWTDWNVDFNTYKEGSAVGEYVAPPGSASSSASGDEPSTPGTDPSATAS